MINGFSKKKIKSKPTLGETLRRARVGKKLTLAELESLTKIRQKYLHSLERDDWNNLPQEVYIRSYTLACARALDLDLSVIMQIFENLARTKRGISAQENLYYKNSFKEIKFLVTPKFLAYFALVGFAVSMFSYIIFQVASFAGSPNLQVMTPLDNLTVDEDEINIEGVTEGNTVLTINQEKVPVTGEGRFSISLKLHRGLNIIEVKATNRINKESSKLLTVEYKPKTALINSTQAN